MMILKERMNILYKIENNFYKRYYYYYKRDIKLN